MFDLIAGLPLHPLVVHATIVLVPLAGLLVAAAAVWPTLRRWAGWLPGLAGVVAAGLAWVTVQAGEALQERLGVEVAEHAAAGKALLPWAAGLAVAGLAVSWWARRSAGTGRRGTGARTGAVGHPVAAIIIAVSLVAGLGTAAMAVRAGHSGATSVWGGVSD